MRAPLVAVVLVAVLGSAALAADDLNVIVDPSANLAAFKTFTIRAGVVRSTRPELDNVLFVKRLRTTIRAALLERGLTEATGPADVFVDFLVAGEDFAVGVPTPGVRGVGPQPVRFTEGTLIIDLVPPGSASPAWRGVYIDEESTGSKLMQKLPDDAKKIIGRFPRAGR